MTKRLIPVLFTVTMALALLAISCGAPSPATQSPAPSPTAASPALGSVVEINLAVEVAENNENWTLQDKPLIDEIVRLSRGTIKFKPNFSEALVKREDTLDGVINGIADMGIINPSFTPGRAPRTQLMELPFVAPHVILGNAIGNQMLPVFAQDLPNVQVINYHSYPPQQIISNVKVTKLEDLKGLKLRTSGLGSQVLPLLGATPVTLNIGEAYMAIQTGVVAGLNYPYGFVTMRKFQEVTKYGVTANLFLPANLVIVNKNVWGKLSDFQKDAMMQAGKNHNMLAGPTVYSMDLEAAAKLRSLGMEITDLSPAEAARWQALVMPIWDSYVTDLDKKGLPGKSLMEQFQKVRKMWGLQ